jgi:Kef-type K+ transport system membrane component KefB
MSIALILGLLFLIGFVADIIGRSTFLPRVTLLMLGGLAVGPSGFALVPESFVKEWFPALTSIALALIGFLLGHQLSIPSLKKRGAQVISISLCKVFGAWLFVAVTLLLAGLDPVMALLLAGIAPATAPAATYDIVHESGATGEFVDTLLSVVAVDDIWGLLIFVLMLTVAGIVSGEAAAGAGIVTSLVNIGSSVLLGVALGAPMAYLTGRIQRGEPMLAEALGFVLLGAGIAEWFGLLPILTAIVMGIMVASLASHHDRPFHAIEGIEWPFMVLFFVLAGASLEVDALLLAGSVTILYMLARFAGIYIGTRLGSRYARAHHAIAKWLGLALLPQAGVAIGMALLAVQRFPETASVVLTVVVASTVILETIGPVFTRLALRNASAEWGPRPGIGPA